MRSPIPLPQFRALSACLLAATSLLHAQAGPRSPSFNVARENIPHGEVKVVEYDSKTLGLRRMLRVSPRPAIPPIADTSRAADSTGSGLGLSISKAIVERHGGTIRVTSQPGHTTFTVVLPQSAAAG